MKIAKVEGEEYYQHLFMVTKAAMKHYYDRFQLDWDDQRFLDFLKQAELHRIADHCTRGYLQLRQDDDALCLFNLQILPHHRGQGIGSQALDYVAQQAQAHRYDTIKLTVFKTNPALSLYQRHQFTITNDDDCYFYLARQIG